MSLIVAVSTTMMTYMHESEECVALVTTAAYDNGQIMQQFGRGAKWVEIKLPHKGVDMVGVCRDCGCAIWRDQEWKFESLAQEGKGSMWHEFEEDCVK